MDPILTNLAGGNEIVRGRDGTGRQHAAREAVAAAAIPMRSGWLGLFFVR
jgi:hypothetical protein